MFSAPLRCRALTRRLPGFPGAPACADDVRAAALAVAVASTVPTLGDVPEPVPRARGSDERDLG